MAVNGRNRNAQRAHGIVGVAYGSMAVAAVAAVECEQRAMDAVEDRDTNVDVDADNTLLRGAVQVAGAANGGDTTLLSVLEQKQKHHWNYSYLYLHLHLYLHPY